MLAPFAYRFSPFAYRFSPYWDRFNKGISVVEAVPIRTETVRKWTEVVRKRCKHGVHLQQAESVLCLCIQAIFPVCVVLGGGWWVVWGFWVVGGGWVVRGMGRFEGGWCVVLGGGRWVVWGFKEVGGV